MILIFFKVKNKYEKQDTIIIIIFRHILGENIILYEIRPRLLFYLHV